MSNFNRVTFLGRITRTPETTAAGSTTITKFGMVEQEYNGKDGDGGSKKKDVFIDVFMWGPRGEALAGLVDVGATILVDARLEFAQWEDKSTGNSRSKHELKIINFELIHDAPNKSDSKPAAKTAAKTAAPF